MAPEMKLTPLLALVVALAVYRGTVLITKDYITDRCRTLLRSLGQHGAYLSECPWCASMWVAAALVPLTIYVSWGYVVDMVLASSAVAGIILDGHKP